MRKIYLVAGMWVALFSAEAQQIATFEEIDLQSGSYYNGSDGAGGFQSGGIWFPNNYNSEYNSWSAFSVSNMKDTITSGYENQYSAITGGGAGSSDNYAVVYFPGELKLGFTNAVNVNGFFVTNSVYAYLSMKNGDQWTKKFGGEDGTDPDHFRLIISGKNDSGNVTDTVEYYLADFRFENSGEDYIVNDWQWIDLSSLGAVNELNFNLESTDRSEWGINTPAYFCIDNFTISDVASHSLFYSGSNAKLNIYPNPVKDKFNIVVPEHIQEISIIDGTGTIIWKDDLPGTGILTVSSLHNKAPGIYFLQVKSQKGVSLEKIIKF